MKRVSRWVFNGLTAVSLLLFVGATVLWVRSYWVGDVIAHLQPKREFFVGTGKGDLVVQWRRMGEKSSIGGRAIGGKDFGHGLHHLKVVPPRQRPYSSLTVVAGRKLAGFAYDRQESYLMSDLHATTYVILLPLWSVVGVSLIVPGAVGWSYWKRRQWRPNCCPACGYDLRATPDRCPECGRVPEKVGG